MNTHLLRTMPQGVLSLSIEALWLANVIHDALDVALANSAVTHDLAPSRLQALRLTSNVFARLGHSGCTAQPVTPFSVAWTPASRLELIRQVAVHWRALIDTAFGTSVSLCLIRTLSEAEVALLNQIQSFAHQLGFKGASALADMQDQYDAMARRQAALQALRCASYLTAVHRWVGAVQAQ